MTGRDRTTQDDSPPRFHLRVFLASPGDVGDERGLARRVLERLPRDPLLRGQTTIEAVAWDDPEAGVPMLATMTPQAAIAKGLRKPSQCDIVIVILWSRMGTPLPGEDRKVDGTPYLSGTEWEYLDALDAAQASGGTPAILIYRRTEVPSLKLSDPEFDEKRRQWLLVQQFFAALHNADGSIKHSHKQYKTPEDFRELLEPDLKSIIVRLQEDRGAPASRPPHSALPAAAPPTWERSPFPGLRAFTPDDAPIFFGRGRETDALVRAFAAPTTRCLVVVGGSGSGKSSLVAAGLLPRLSANAIEGSKDWLLPYVVSVADGKPWTGLRFTPGELSDNPFVPMAAKFASLLPGEPMVARTLAERLAAAPEAFEELVEAVLQSRQPWAELVMFIDQFEELFTVVAKRYREPFINLLAAAARTPRLRIVATLRADFYHLCLEFPALADLLRNGTFPLAAPTPAALTDMVRGPAAQAGLVFDDGLDDDILSDTGTDPGALALLAFALHELYKARSRPEGRLTRAAYAAFDGVRGAISKRAENTFARLSAAAQDRLGGVFRELVRVEERGVATRRRAPRARLVSSPEAAELVDAFTAARLLVTDRQPGGEAVVEVAHEALWREWPRLKNWVSEFADDLRLLQQVDAAAADWQFAGRDPSHLWPHERLVLVEQALARLGKERTTLYEPAKSFVRPEAERLLEELELPDTTHYRRAEIGDRLDKIGDPRRGVRLLPNGLPDIVWCEVPGGTVTLEKVEGTFTVEPFCIAKYPITYAQYRAFLLHPGGYGNKRWWKDLKHERTPGEQYRPIGNCPAENVSWYDAMAYCRWLSARLGQDVRLPTEWQWQQAATGGRPDYTYPWGTDWVEGCANTYESHLSRTTAVGMYPRGASVQNVRDLAGNVWEWCLNKHDQPRDGDLGSDAPRVVRGGSWDFNRVNARCAYRSHGHPVYRGGDIGFRVVRVSPHLLNH